jgi:hypothetical protein
MRDSVWGTGASGSPGAYLLDRKVVNEHIHNEARTSDIESERSAGSFLAFLAATNMSSPVLVPSYLHNSWTGPYSPFSISYTRTRQPAHPFGTIFYRHVNKISIAGLHHGKASSPLWNDGNNNPFRLSRCAPIRIVAHQKQFPALASSDPA